MDDASQYGVIVFSFGGNIQSADMTDETVQMFYNVFANLKQSIIWKWESKDIPSGKPDNVHMIQWLPQADLLAQPQTRFFISHCGISSIFEAKFHGVPILAIVRIISNCNVYFFSNIDFLFSSQLVWISFRMQNKSIAKAGL